MLVQINIINKKYTRHIYLRFNFYTNPWCWEKLKAKEILKNRKSVTKVQDRNFKKVALG